MTEALLLYLRQYTRNKIVFCADGIDGISFVNVGLVLSQIIQQSFGNPDAALKNMLASSLEKNCEIGHYLALDNVGILFEPELRLDIRSLIDSYSKNQCLIIRSEAEISNDMFYWQSKDDDVRVSLSGLSYIQL